MRSRDGRRPRTLGEYFVELALDPHDQFFNELFADGIKSHLEHVCCCVSGCNNLAYSILRKLTKAVFVMPCFLPSLVKKSRTVFLGKSPPERLRGARVRVWVLVGRMMQRSLRFDETASFYFLSKIEVLK